MFRKLISMLIMITCLYQNAGYCVTEENFTLRIPAEGSSRIQKAIQIQLNAMKKKLAIPSSFEGTDSKRRQYIFDLIDTLLSGSSDYNAEKSWLPFTYIITVQGHDPIKVIKYKKSLLITCGHQKLILSKNGKYFRYYGCTRYEYKLRCLRKLFKALKGDELEVRRDLQFKDAHDDDYWDDWYSRKSPDEGFYAYDTYREYLHPLVVGIIQKALPLISQDKEISILDIFSGDGIFIKQLDKTLKPSLGSRDKRYILIDRNARLCETARKKLRKLPATIFTEDLTKLKDIETLIRVRPQCITAIGGIQEQVVNYKDAIAICNRVYHLLPEGGIFIVSGYWPSRLDSDDFRNIGFEVINMSVPARALGESAYMSHCYVLWKPNSGMIDKGIKQTRNLQRQIKEKISSKNPRTDL